MNYKINYKNLIALIVVSQLFCSNILLPTTQKSKNIYGELETLLMPSIIKTEDDSDKIINNKKADTKTNEIKLPKLSNYESHKIIFEILQNNKKAQITDKKIINKNLAKDLNLFSGEQLNPNKNLINSIGRTKTKVGKIQLSKIIFSPTKNINKLRNRQTLIKNLLEREDIFVELEKNLEIIKENENDFLAFWKEFDVLSKRLIQDFFYFQAEPLKKLNSSATALQLSTSFIVSMVILGMIAEPFVFAGYGYAMSGGNEYNITNPSQKTIISTLVGMGFGILLSRQIYIQTLKPLITSLKSIQKRMINVSKYLSAFNAINQIVQKHDFFEEAMPNTKEANNHFTKNKTNIYMNKLLRKNTFKGQSSFFSNHGNILATFKLIENQKETFEKSMKFIGKIDAYLSMAKLYKENQNNDNAKYCFVEFIADEDKPVVKLENFWHPMLNPNEVITNDIELGISNDKITLTGPNAAGKSTILKAVTINILLAQSFGITPADNMILTPFSIINTYLNITDTIGEESLFQAEMYRIRDLIKLIKNSDNNFVFIIMDEIFTGTNPEEGQAAAYGIGMRLAEFKNVIGILATHFKYLTNLENKTNGEFENYKVTASKNDDGSFTYPYKLLKGISSQKIALDLIANEGFDSKILEHAYQTLEVQAL